MAHVLGWLTVAAEAGVGAWCMRWLWHSSVEPIRRKVPVPKLIHDVHLSGGSDFVGSV